MFSPFTLKALNGKDHAKSFKQFLYFPLQDIKASESTLYIYIIVLQVVSKDATNSEELRCKESSQTKLER